MSPIDLYFIVLSAVIAGGLLTTVVVMYAIRHTRSDKSDEVPAFFPDLFLTLLAFAFVGYGMWRAGLFGG